MNDKIEKLKADLSKELKKELSDNTVKVTLTLNSYGFYTQIKERTAQSLRNENISMRNIKGQWIQ